jgi:hypothetical protein
MLFRRVAIEPLAELDGVLVAFLVGIEIELGVVIVSETFPLTELVEENDGFGPLSEGAVPVVAIPDEDTGLEELVEVAAVVEPFPNEVIGVSVMLAEGEEAVESVGDGIPGMLVVGMELPVPVGEVVPVSVAVITELPKFVGNDVLVSFVVVMKLLVPVGEVVTLTVGVVIELPNSVMMGVAVPSVVGIELPESVGKDVLIPVEVVIVFEELAVGDKVGVVLVVLPYGGVTEFMEVLEEFGLNVSEEPWAQEAKRTKRRKMARHFSPPEIRIIMTGF